MQVEVEPKRFMDDARSLRRSRQANKEEPCEKEFDEARPAD
jgi:hypothetical protein